MIKFIGSFKPGIKDNYICMHAAVLPVPNRFIKITGTGLFGDNDVNDCYTVCNDRGENRFLPGEWFLVAENAYIPEEIEALRSSGEDGYGSQSFNKPGIAANS